MAVTYDFQTPGANTSAADTQEDIRNIAEASATLYNQSHTLANIPTNAVRWNTSSKLFQLYNGASWGNLEIANIVGSNGILSLNGTRILINSSGDAQLQIATDNGNTGTTTWDPKVTFNTYTTERARIYTDTSDSHKLKFDVGGSDWWTIDSAGVSNNLGKLRIGAGTPSYDFEISKSNDSNPVGSIQNTHATGYSGFEFYDSGSVADLYFGLERNDTNGTRLNYINGDFTIYRNGTATAVFDSSGKVGIGTSAPYSSLTVRGTGNSINLDLNSTTTGSNSSIVWNGSTLDSNPNYSVAITGYREGSGAAGALGLKTRNGTSGNLEERMLIDSSGKVGIGTSSPSHKLDVVGDIQIDTGNLVIGTSGKGIDFSATSGTGTSELLDDYEEGTFDPTLTTIGTDFTSVTYSVSRLGRYTKIGNTVHVYIRLATTGVTKGSASGTVAVGGLPFTANNTTYLNYSVSVITQDWAANPPAAGQVVANTNLIYLYQSQGSTGAVAGTAVSDVSTGFNNNDVTIVATYRV